jgi:uncharacterized tellurite resistance protein B-like protein
VRVTGCVEVLMVHLVRRHENNAMLPIYTHEILLSLVPEQRIACWFTAKTCASADSQMQELERLTERWVADLGMAEN